MSEAFSTDEAGISKRYLQRVYLMLTTISPASETTQEHTHAEIDRVLSPLVEELASAGDTIAIVAGHYCVSSALSELSNESDPERMSFLAGARLMKRLTRMQKRCVLLLWINDIGICPIERAALKEAARVPDNYRSILADEGLAPDVVTVMFESTMRNKASTSLRKIIKKKPKVFARLPSDGPGLIRCIDPAYCSFEQTTEDRFVYTVPGPQGEALVVKEGPNPKCNFILANLIEQIVKTHGAAKIVNIFNDLYLPRIGLGIHVARLLYDVTADIRNLFTDGETIFLEPSDTSD